MAQGIQFKIPFLDEASEFLRTLADAPREKKKTWKVPVKEIARAEGLRKKYYESIWRLLWR